MYRQIYSTLSGPNVTIVLWEYRFVIWSSFQLNFGEKRKKDEWCKKFSWKK